MIPETTCSKCSSERLVSDLCVHTGINIGLDPPTIVGPGRGSSEVRARACCRCGYVELYAVSPRTIWNEKQRRKEKEDAARRPNLPLPADGGERPRRDLPRPSSAEESE